MRKLSFGTLAALAAGAAHMDHVSFARPFSLTAGCNKYTPHQGKKETARRLRKSKKEGA